jgi:hypothetical protein
MDNDIEIFDGKTLSDLFKEIHTITNKKHLLILSTIIELKKYVTSPDTLALVAPIIREYIDVLVKNDEHFVKLATIVQRIISAKAYSGVLQEGGEFNLTLEERAELTKLATAEIDGHLIRLNEKVQTLPKS